MCWLASGGPRFRWLSRGKVLQWLLDLQDELEIFLTEKKCGLVNKLMNKMRFLQVGYLDDIFGALNDLNINMQGRNQTTVGVAENLPSFKCKLELRLRNVKRGKFAAFCNWQNFSRHERTHFRMMSSFIVEDLTELMSEFDRCISVEHTNPVMGEKLFQPKWRRPARKHSRNPRENYWGSNWKVVEGPLQGSISEIWIQVKKEKSVVGVEAVKVLVPFAATYLCEHGFSVLTHEN